MSRSDHAAAAEGEEEVVDREERVDGLTREQDPNLFRIHGHHGVAVGKSRLIFELERRRAQHRGERSQHRRTDPRAGMDLKLRKRGLWSMKEDDGVTNGSPGSVITVIEPLDVEEDEVSGTACLSRRW